MEINIEKEYFICSIKDIYECFCGGINRIKKVYYGNSRDKTASELVGSHPALWFESGQAKPRTSGYVHY
jgi:hypothetical protein